MPELGDYQTARNRESGWVKSPRSSAVERLIVVGDAAAIIRDGAGSRGTVAAASAMVVATGRRQRASS